MNAIAGALGFMPAADPKAYTNQVTVTQQTTQATTALNATVGLISAFSVAMNILPGQDSAFLQKVNDLNTKAQAATTNAVNQTPAQIAKTTSDLTTAFTALQTQNTHVQPPPKTELQTLQDALTTINNRITELEVKGISPDLLKPYLDLQLKTRGQITDLINLQIRQKQAALADLSGAIEPFQDASQPIDDPIATLEHLNAATQAAIDNDTSSEGTFKRILSKAGIAIYYILLVICLWLGGTATTNTFYKESIPVKLWYFIYGAILFQITIPLYGIIFTPKWHALIIPLFDNTTKGIIQDLFGYNVHAGPASSEEVKEVEEDEAVQEGGDPNATAAAATATTAPAKPILPRKPIDSTQVLRGVSLIAFIVFEVFYSQLVKYF